ncbi:MAG: archaemetzincin family Zn-dependent metalloprotease [Nitrospirae bacterium]|nr:archaemetzincin family Zn-dependent metalloprotease [Nitrospirota bacterium]
MWFQEAKRIFILPAGKIQWWLLSEVKEHVQDVFGKETVIAEEMPLPAAVLNRDRGQIHSTGLIEAIAERGYNGMVLGMIDFDLYVPGLNFVFGEADPAEGVAVVSIARLREEFYGREPDQDLLLQRTLKEAIHEMGHLYSLKHCPDPVCVMHFSNSITETDRKSKEFCSVCIRIMKNL